MNSCNTMTWVNSKDELQISCNNRRNKKTHCHMSTNMDNQHNVKAALLFMLNGV